MTTRVSARATELGTVLAQSGVRAFMEAIRDEDRDVLHALCEEFARALVRSIEGAKSVQAQLQAFVDKVRAIEAAAAESQGGN